jgi:hypothetical protein
MRNGLLWGVALACVGCAHEEEGPEPLRYANEGSLCLSSDANDVLHVQVVAPECLASCDRLGESLCRLRVEGDRLEIQSSFTIAHTPGGCHPVCQPAIAQCSSGLAVSGDFTLNHGSETASVSLPQSKLALFEKWPGTHSCTPLSP